MAELAYKTIVLHWDAGLPSAAADAAGLIARRFGAHVTLTCLGIEPGVAAYGYAAPGAAAIALQAENAREEAARLKGEAEDWLNASGIAGDTRALTCPVDLIAETMASVGRVSDLVVAAPPYGADREDTAIRALEGALFEGSAPVLVVPGPAETVGTRVVIAWDGGLEALHAARAALPFLVRAEVVEILMVDPSPGPEDAEPGADFAVFLSRHGAPVTLAPVPSAGHRVGEVIRRRVRESGADLLVMGAYGHSRLREALIGGPTRELLEDLPAAPVLLAH